MREALVEAIKNLPEGYRLRSVSKLNLRSESLAGSIVIFDSNYLTESTDAIVAALAELYAAERGGVSLGLLMHEDDRAKAFSLFPQNSNHIDSMGHYRLQAGRVQGLGRSEWFWLLDSQRKKLQQLGDNHADAVNLLADQADFVAHRLAAEHPQDLRLHHAEVAERVHRADVERDLRRPVAVLVVVWLSLHRWDLLSPIRYVGLENWRSVLTDSAFGNSLLVTLVFIAIVVPAQIVLGLAAHAMASGLPTPRACYGLCDDGGCVTLWRSPPVSNVPPQRSEP